MGWNYWSDEPTTEFTDSELEEHDAEVREYERTKVATEILKDVESFCKDNTRQSFNWSEVWLGLWKILKEKYGAEH